MTGTVHEKFRVERKLGEGAMGEVWLATDTALGRRVALKFIKSEDPQEAERFKREAQMVAKLDHPSIAKIFETGDGYIAMQYVEGQSLDDMDMKPTVSKAAGFVRQAALAVHHAHEHGVVHRDIKPGNIMVGKDGHVWVMDFGLAKQVSVRSSLSVSGMILGTPSYMPPEQADGRSNLARPESDVYSLGATLYQLVTGKPPFSGLGVYDTIRKVVEEEPVPPRSIAKGLEPELEAVIMKCLEKEPYRRYRTALELAEDLGRYAKGLPVEAHHGFGYRAIKLARRYRRPILVAAAVVTIMVGAIVWSLASGLRARDAELAKLRAETGLKNAEIERLQLLEEAHRAEAEKAKSEKAGRLLVEGINLTKRGRLDDAIAKYDEALALDPKLLHAYIERSTAKVVQKDYDGAIRDCTAGLEIDPNYAEGYSVRGAISLARQDLDAAMMDFDKALLIKPALYLTRMNRAQILIVRGEKAGAIEELEIVLAKAPADWKDRPHAEKLLKELRED